MRENGKKVGGKEGRTMKKERKRKKKGRKRITYLKDSRKREKERERRRFGDMLLQITAE